jgi:outer membrane protein TolC
MAAAVAGAGLVLANCARYQAQPIDPSTATDALAMPDATAVKEASSRIHHPLLQSVPIDLAEPLTADGIAVLAVIVNPALRTARDQRGVAAAQVLQAGILPNPQLSAGVAEPFAGDLEGTTTGFSFGVSWDISSLITRDARERAARRAASSVDLGIAWQEWQTAMAAKQGYYRLLGARARLAENEATLKRISAIGELIERGLSIGAITVSDETASAAALVEAHDAVLESRQEAEMQRLALSRLIGVPSDAPLALDQVEWPSGAPAEIDVPDNLERDRLDLRALRLGYASQEETLRAAVLAQFPKIGIGLVDSRDTGNIQSIGPVITFDLPIFDRNQGAIATETATRQRLHDEYVQRVFEARHDLAEALAEARLTEQRIKATDGAVTALAGRAEAASTALQRGHVNVMAVESAQAALAQKRLEAIQLRQRLAELLIAIELAGGRYLPHAAESSP